MGGRISRSRHPDSMRQVLLSALLPTLVLFILAPAVGGAQVPVVTDITSSGLGTEVPLQLPPDGIYNITGGTRPGGGFNLFHSFGDFTVGPGHVANFLNDTGLPTSNILGRVTELGVEHTSFIYGTIRTTGFGDANLFLVNPNGIVFGPQGSFDVGGSVSMSTANYLGFEGTPTLFDMLSSPTSLDLLDIAPVVAFGFTSPAPTSPITVQGSVLQVLKGEALSLVGGDITIQAGTLDDGTIQTASLLAPGGQLNLMSVASPGEVLVPSFQTGPNIDGASFNAMGAVTINEGAMLDVSGQLEFDADGNPIGGNSGTVFVRGGQLVMDTSTIQAITFGAVDGASTAVDIQVSRDVALSNFSAIFAFTFGPGSGGIVQLTAGTMTMENAVSITTGTIDGGGIGGDVVLNMGTVSLMDGSSIVSQSSQTLSPGLGHGGNITIQGLPGSEFGAAESVTLSGDSKLFSSTDGLGGGGRVAITAKSLTMEGDFTTVNAESVAEGLGGDIVVGVLHARLSDGATIKTLTGSADPNAPSAATVTVQGLGEPKAVSVAISGVGSSGVGSGIVSETTGSARSGKVTVQSETVSLTDGAVIQTGTVGTNGAGGDVAVDADSVDISGGSRITSLSAAEDAGQVAIKANTLTLDNGFIETFTSSGGLGGEVVLDLGAVTLLSNSAKINSSTSDAGRAGDIKITTGSLTLTNHSEITNSSSGGIEIETGAGDAGNITIQSGSTVLLNDSSITTEASEASGGQITINAPEMIRLTNSEVSTSVKGVSGGSDGGNIAIDPLFVILQNSQLVAQANAGAGGAINVIAGVFIADPSTLVSATSQSGPQGTVNIQSPVQNVGGELAALSDEFASAAALLAQQCAARVADGKFSTFVIAGREGLPSEPGGFLASPSWMTELRGSRLSGRDQQTTLSAAMDLFPKYEVRPIQLAKFEPACHR